MKELSIVEKACRYDEAIERAESIYNETAIPSATTKGICTYIFPELAESEDENIRKSLIDMLKNDEKCYLKEIAWLEKQGEHANFRNKIQIGDKVTRNEDGVLVNLSQLKRVAKKDEKQCEQNPAWSEEDEKMFEHIIAKATLHFSSINYLDEEEINFLKSLRPRSEWKPSDEQMNALSKAIAFVFDSNSDVKHSLESLYNELKKL